MMTGMMIVAGIATAWAGSRKGDQHDALEKRAAAAPHIAEYEPFLLTDDQEEFADEPVNGTGALRGPLTGILLGAGLWCAIAALVRAIRV
jgi:hypothetical protein